MTAAGQFTRIAILWLAAFLSCSAFAQAEEYEYAVIEVENGQSFDSGWQASPDGPNSAWWLWLQGIQPACAAGHQRYEYGNFRVNAAKTTGYADRRLIVCQPYSADSWATISVAIRRRVKEVPTCSSGTTQSQTFSAAWGRTPNVGDAESNLVNGLVPYPALYCDGSCESIHQEVTDCWLDQTASPNGYYEYTCSHDYQTNGNACTVGTATPDNPEPAPATPPPDPGDGSPGPDPNPNPSPEAPTPGDGNGGAPTGDPSTPGGGTPGGGSTASDGTCGGNTGIVCTPSGTNPGPTTGEVPAPCGAPGQPECTVRVNEFGTPNASSTLTSRITWAGNENKHVTDVFTNQAKKSDLPNKWTYTPPTGSCAPITGDAGILGSINIDICNNSLINLLRALWSWAFAIGGCLYIWRSLSEGI